MSEDNKKKTTDKTIQITPDAQNARSANAIPNRDILSAEPDLNGIVPEDDILEIIRQRKAAESKSSESGTEPSELPADAPEASDISDADEFLLEGLDHELSAPAPKGEDTKVVDRDTFNESIDAAAVDKKRTITVDTGSSSDKDSSLDDAKWSVPERDDVDIEDFFYHEPPEKPEKKSAEKDADAPASDAEAESDELLRELVGEDTDSDEDTRLGFKPYTREIKSMELAAAAEKAAAEQAEREANSFSGKIKRMAKKKKSNAAGAGASGSKSSGSKSSGPKSSKS